MKRFEDNARVCFVGDSITNNGTFLKYIVSTYRTEFPNSKIEFYNCGISGGGIGNSIRVFEEDVAIYDPTHIVLMIGINDAGLGILREPLSKERYEKLFECYTNYRNNLERFYNITRERNIKLILCTQMPYAEYIESEIPIYPGGCALLQGYAEFVRDFAREHGIELCDYHRAATEAMHSENLYNPDRVHPNAKGHALMAKTFLLSQGIVFDTDESIGEDIEEWYKITQKLRNIVAAEFFNVPKFTEKTSAEREDFLQKRYEEIQNGTYKTDAYFTSLIEAYVKEKPHQAEYIELLKQFMKANKQ